MGGMNTDKLSIGKQQQHSALHKTYSIKSIQTHHFKFFLTLIPFLWNDASQLAIIFISLYQFSMNMNILIFN